LTKWPVFLQNAFGNAVYVNQTNLNGKLRKKLGGQTGGQAKNWGSMAHPGSPLESPLWNAIRIYEKRKASKKKKRKFLAVLAKTPRLNRFF